MKGSSLSQKMGLISLGFLTVIFRYPFIESPTGSDNFIYISSSKAILNHGQIFWAEHILSFYGLFPGSTPLGGLILASAVTELTGLSIHNYQLIHSIFMSFLYTFGFFMLSGEFSSNYKSRWFGSLAFSLAPRFLTITIWRFSIRALLMAFIPLLFWLIIRLLNKKYGRHPKKLLIILFSVFIILPSLHRIGLRFFGIFIPLIFSFLLWFWQESAVNRERAGRQILFFLFSLSFYFFYLQYLDFSPYAPDLDFFGIYYMGGGDIFSTFINLGVYYLINAGPLIFLSLIGIIFWIQEGRVNFSHVFSLSYLCLLTFFISDLIYIPYLFTFGILLFVPSGIDFFIDNLEDYKIRFQVFFSVLILLFLSFSSLDLNYRLSSHDNEDLYSSYNVRESSISVGLWSCQNLGSEIFESNDQRRPRRIAAYSELINIDDTEMLPVGLISISDMNLSKLPLSEIYWNNSNYLWKWEDYNNFSSENNKELRVSIINLKFANFSGQSSTSSLTLNYYYKNMPNYNYKLYNTKELAVFWTEDY